MAGHAQLKFVMTECSKTQIRLTGLKCNNTRKGMQEKEPAIFVLWELKIRLLRVTVLGTRLAKRLPS